MSSAENKAKDFEYMLAEVEYKMQKERAEGKEDQLRDEIRRMQRELDALGSHQDQIKSESSDLLKEIKALNLQVEDYQKRASTNEFLLKQSVLEKEKIQAKVALAEKEMASLHEKLREKDNKIMELTKKTVDIEAEHLKAMEKKEHEYLQALKKSCMELQIARDQLKKSEEDAEAMMVRTRNHTYLLPQFDNPQHRPASGTMMLDLPASLVEPVSNYTTSEIVATGVTNNTTAHLVDSGFENNDLEPENTSRKDSFALQMGGSGGPFRRDTGDSRLNGSSATNSRRDSLVSNRLAWKGLAFGAKPSDTKLQAEVNELKIKLKEAHQECSNKVNQLLVVSALL